MKSKKTKIAGFALFEILVATLILAGVIYAFVAFSQTQNKQKAEENRGKYLAILTNKIIESTLPDSNCSKKNTYKLSTCVNISSQFKDLMKNNGFDLANTTVEVVTLSNAPYQNMMTVTIQFPNGAYSSVQASIYGQQVMNNFTPDSVRRFTANTPSSYLFSYAVGDQNKDKLQGNMLRFYLTLKDGNS